MLVTYKQYQEDRQQFIIKHGGLQKSYTSQLDQYNQYHKEYLCEDGAIFYGVNGPEFTTVPITVNLVKL